MRVLWVLYHLRGQAVEGQKVLDVSVRLLHHVGINDILFGDEPMLDLFF